MSAGAHCAPDAVPAAADLPSALPFEPRVPVGEAEGRAVGDAVGVADGFGDAEGDGDGFTVLHALPYAVAGNSVRDCRAAVDACSAAAWLADRLGPLPPNSQAATIRTPRPPPRMKNRRRQYAAGSAGPFRLLFVIWRMHRVCDGMGYVPGRPAGKAGKASC